MDLITVLVMRVMGILLGLSVCMIRPIEPINNNDLRNQLQIAAKNALKAIDSNAVLSASEHRAARGQHVFNNGLLRFHEKVLNDLQKDLLDYIIIPDEKMELLKQRLNIPLSTDAQRDIGDMVVHFSTEEFYVDYNACVYGEYVKQLRQTIVELLKSSTAIDCEIDKANNICERVKLMADKMVEHDVYVDPMARDHWLKQNKNLQLQRQQQYNKVRNELQNMFQNILTNFREVYKTICHFRWTNTWNR